MLQPVTGPTSAVAFLCVHCCTVSLEDGPFTRCNMYRNYISNVLLNNKHVVFDLIYLFG